MELLAQMLFVCFICISLWHKKRSYLKFPFYKLHGCVSHGSAVSESWQRQCGVAPQAATCRGHRHKLCSRWTPSDDGSGVLPILSPKLAQASSTPDQPQIIPGHTAFSRALSQFPSWNQPQQCRDRPFTVHKQPLAGFAPHPRAVSGAHLVAPAMSQVEGGSQGLFQELPRD